MSEQTQMHKDHLAVPGDEQGALAKARGGDPVRPKPSDVLFLLAANLALFLDITLICYSVGLPAFVAALLSVIAILAFTRCAVRLILRRGPRP